MFPLQIMGDISLNQARLGNLHRRLPSHPKVTTISVGKLAENPPSTPKGVLQVNIHLNHVATSDLKLRAANHAFTSAILGISRSFARSG